MKEKDYLEYDPNEGSKSGSGKPHEGPQGIIIAVAASFCLCARIDLFRFRRVVALYESTGSVTRAGELLSNKGYS
jgi:hypothetical protein